MQKLCNHPVDCEKEMEESRLRHLFSTIDRSQAKFSLAGLSVKAITFKFSVLLSQNFLFFQQDFSKTRYAILLFGNSCALQTHCTILQAISSVKATTITKIFVPFRVFSLLKIGLWASAHARCSVVKKALSYEYWGAAGN